MGSHKTAVTRSIAIALVLLQSCTKLSKCSLISLTSLFQVDDTILRGTYWVISIGVVNSDEKVLSRRQWFVSANDYGSLVHVATNVLIESRERDIQPRVLLWRHNGRDSVSNHQPHDCLFNCLFRRRSKKTSKLRVTGLCVGNSPGTGEFPAQMASNAENVSIWWRHHGDPLQGRLDQRTSTLRLKQYSRHFANNAFSWMKM